MNDLTCKQAEKLIPSFLNDEMEKKKKKQFLAHVEHCSFCLEELSIQFLVTAGMQRLEKGDTFDLNRELKLKIATEKRHLHILASLQRGLYVTEIFSAAAAVAILLTVVLK